MAYVVINGVRYEKELIDMANDHGTSGGRISKEEVMSLIDSAADGQEVTDTELRTLKYIRGNYNFTDAAADVFDEEILKF